MEGGGGADDGDVRLGQVVLVRFLHHHLQQGFGEGMYVLHMKPALAVAELHDVAEYVDHQAAAVLFLIDLLGHHGGQLLLLGVEQDGVHHPVPDDERVEGPGDEIGDAQLEGPLDVAGPPLRRDHNHRDVLDPVIFIHHVQHAEAVHLRHDDIQQHKGDLRTMLLQHGHALQAVFRLQDVELVSQHIRQDGAVHL